MKFGIMLALLCLMLGSTWAAPRRLEKVEEKDQGAPGTVPEGAKVEETVNEPEDVDEDLDTGLMYDQYLKKVLKILESDANLRKKMEESSVDDIKNGKLSKEVNFLPWELRQKLNGVKQEEMHRLRKMIQAKNIVDKGGKIKRSSYLHQIANHIDHKNPHSFEASDLTNLIQAATSDLEEYDSEREDEFKQMEMEKEVRREEKLRKLDEQDRKRAEEEYVKQQREAATKHKTNHPGSRAQLEELWNDDDGLEDQQFDPRTFFNLHDQNGDGYMDHTELEALFSKDLERAYDDMKDSHQRDIRVEEEKRRMRKHVMKEVDKDGDHLVSLSEFVNYAGTKQFDSPDQDSYKSIDDLLLEHALYTATELDRYRDEIHRQEEEIRVKLEALKAEAKNLGGLRRDLTDEKREAMKDGKAEEHEQLSLAAKEADMKKQEAKVQQLHQQLQNQSKDVVDMKRKLKTHEASEKILNNIMDNLDGMEEGQEKEAAVAKAHKDLDNVRKAQAAVENREHPVVSMKKENNDVKAAEQQAEKQKELPEGDDDKKL